MIVMIPRLFLDESFKTYAVYIFLEYLCIYFIHACICTVYVCFYIRGWSQKVYFDCFNLKETCLWSDPLLCGSAWFQMGSYFGSSLCAVDLNQDGLSDLLVGGPHAQPAPGMRARCLCTSARATWVGSVGQRELDTLTHRLTCCSLSLSLSTQMYMSGLLLLAHCWSLALLLFDLFPDRIYYHVHRLKRLRNVWFSSEII